MLPNVHPRCLPLQMCRSKVKTELNGFGGNLVEEAWLDLSGWPICDHITSAAGDNQRLGLLRFSFFGQCLNLQRLSEEEYDQSRLVSSRCLKVPEAFRICWRLHRGWPWRMSNPGDFYLQPLAHCRSAAPVSKKGERENTGCCDSCSRGENGWATKGSRRDLRGESWGEGSLVICKDIAGMSCPEKCYCYVLLLLLECCYCATVTINIWMVAI